MSETATAPLLDTDRFRRLMASLASGVAVVTGVDSDGDLRGLTTTAVTSVSLEPPQLLVCVAHDSRTLPALRHAGCFAVNLLEASHHSLARAFASKGDDKFAGVSWRTGRTGSPILYAHSLAWAECETVHELEAGDHVVLIGRVVHCDTALDDLEPLTYFRRSFGSWAPTTLAERSAS